MIKKVYTILVLFKNVLFKHKKYKLHFIAENDPPIKRWYYDFKHWGFEHGNLEMVSGADTLCEYYAKGKDEVTINITASRKPRPYCLNLCDEFVGEPLPKEMGLIGKYLYGRYYIHYNHNDGHKTRMWICPVTLFVLGRYPKYIYVRRGI